ncbi:golgin candidate 5-like [Bidens hawaiensis]|uniref:golgin candidate 5-like n=1 Tax=Bidens hawaiensis TaxID=980011 RepID=UPI00404A3C42
MAWLRGKVALPDLAGAVNKISESVKNIEKNFDNALGLDDQPPAAANSDSTIDGSYELCKCFAASHSWSPDFEGQNDHTPKTIQSSSKESESSQKHDDSSEKHDESSTNRPKGGTDADDSTNFTEEKTSVGALEHPNHPVETNLEIHEESDIVIRDRTDGIVVFPDEAETIPEKQEETSIATSDEAAVTFDNRIEVETDSQTKPSADDADESEQGENSKVGSTKDFVSISFANHDAIESEPHELQSNVPEVRESVKESQPHLLTSSDDASEMVPDVVSKDKNENAKAHTVNQFAGDEHNTSSDSTVELETLKLELKKMETALLVVHNHYRYLSQAKADEIEKLMNENEQLKSINYDQKRKSSADIESLQEEYHQSVSALERKVYALKRERDTLRREQNKRSDATALLKEKDEIITQVMAEGEELSKKQAVQESRIRKLRTQIREFEEEKKGMIKKLQIEENRVESLKKENSAIEKLLQETIDKNKTEIAAQKEHFMNLLNAAKEETSLAEARGNNEARTALESRLREAKEREAMLVQTLEELRTTLSRKEQQAVYREDMLRKDIDDLQKRYQESERRSEELVMQVPESTRPLLRQIEAMQEATNRKAEAWAAAESSLNIQLQDAEAKVAAAEERDRSINEHLSQTLSRVNVLEAQISCLKAEQTQLTRSLEKERQRASENRQDYLALKEEANTHKCHVNQLDEEMKKLKRKHKLEMQEALTQHKLLQQDIEREKIARIEIERSTQVHSPVRGQSSIPTTNIPNSYTGLTRRLSSASNLSSMEYSQREPTVSSFYLKSMTPSAFQAALRQKEGEVASYMSRLASMETIRDSLSEELVKMTKECKKLRSEAALLPSIKAELEALRFRHTAALELMGERDEELEELRADIVDLKEMYREQVDMLVDKVIDPPKTALKL